ISHGATDYALTDRLQYPHVFKMMPNDRIYYTVVVTFLKYFKWNWVGIFSSDDVTGETESKVLTDYLASNDICVAFRIKSNIDLHKEQILERNKIIMKKSGAKIIIICGSHSPATFSRLTLLLGKVHDMILIYSSSYFYSIEKHELSLPTFDGSFTLTPSNCNYSCPWRVFSLDHPSKYPEDKLLEHTWIKGLTCLSLNQLSDTFYSKLYRLSLKNCSTKYQKTFSEHELPATFLSRMINGLESLVKSLQATLFHNIRLFNKTLKNLSFRHQ
ncbi:Hypothetical predicted protein, partial [Pelobates cultripes]